MADTPETPVEETPVAEAPASKGPTIKESVAEKLAASGPTVRELVVTQLTNEEIDRRAQIVRKAITIIEDNKRELNKIRPAPLGFDGNGKSVEGTLFTKEQVDSRKKLNEQNTKVDAALTKALEQSDFLKLIEVVGSK